MKQYIVYFVDFAGNERAALYLCRTGNEAKQRFHSEFGDIAVLEGVAIA